MSANRQRTILLALVIMAALVIIRLVAAAMLPFADTTEPRYAEIARLMAVSNDWITPWYQEGTPFWGKPPLSFWFQALSIKLLGTSELAIRLPALVMSVLTVLILARYVRQTQGTLMAVFAGLIYLSMALPFVSAGAVMTDTFLVFGTSFSIIGFLLHYQSQNRISPYYFYLGMAIGLLSKGPIAAIFCLTPILVAIITSPQQRSLIIEKLHWKKGLALLVLLVLPWYIMAEIKTPGFLNYFILGEHVYRYLDPGWQGDLYGSAHDRPRGTIWLYWIMASFPWGLLFLGILLTRLRSLWEGKSGFNLTFEDKVMVSSLLTPLIFFTAAGNILWTYALPSLPFTALLIVKLWRSSNAKKVQRAQYIALVVPFTTVLLIALVIYGSIPLNSQKMLIAKALEEGQSMNSIYYLNKTPFSGRFYTNGNATTVDIDGFRRQLGKSDDDLYLIIDNRQFSELGTLQGIHTELLMDNGSYSLYGLTRMNTDSAQLSIR